MATTKENKLIREIIQRYGNNLDLKTSPYLIVEIIRQYGPKFDIGPVAECAPPGGPPKMPNPGDLLKEVRTRLAEVTRLAASLEKSMSAGQAVKSATRTTRGK